MSYIKIEIGGKERGLKFNLLAFEILADYNTDDTTSGFMYAVYYGGLRGNSKVKNEEPDYNFEEVCDWVDNMKDRIKVNGDVINCMKSTQLWQDLAVIGKEETGKKKVQKKQPMIT